MQRVSKENQRKPLGKMQDTKAQPNHGKCGLHDGLVEEEEFGERLRSRPDLSDRG